MVCTIFFYSMFQLCHNETPLMFLSKGFSWFWFMIVLFQMFVVYMSLGVVEHYAKRLKIVTPGLIVISLLTFVLFVKSTHIYFAVWRISSWGYFMEYFQFFAFGILCRKYYPKMINFLRSNSFRTLIILSYIASLFVVYGFNEQLKEYNSNIYNIMQMLVVRYTGLITIFILFFNNDKYFSSDDKPCRWLRFIGRRTLDIYMLNVFFLPNLLMLKPYLTGNGMLLSQLAIGLSAAVLDISVCLFISNLLRSSKFLSRWLFGEKTEKVTLSVQPILP